MGVWTGKSVMGKKGMKSSIHRIYVQNKGGPKSGGKKKSSIEVVVCNAA